MQPQILVPLDGSPGAETIFTPLIPLARATGSGLTLVQAVPIDLGVVSMLGAQLPAEPTPEEQTRVHQDASGYLADVAGRVGRPGEPIQTAVLDGEPSAAILAYVIDHPEVRGVAMATHGRQGLTRWIFGSVAEEILHQAPVPVLLLRRPAVAPPAGAGAGAELRTIVVPVDGSAFAEGALDQACHLAQATGASLVLVTAVDGLDAAGVATDEIPLWIQQQQQIEVDSRVLYQQRLAAQLHEQGLTVDVQIVEGRPAEVILAQSAEVHADLIVMATHGRTGFGRLRLGSVALAVVEHATCPVFLVREPRHNGRMPEWAGAESASGRPGAGRVDTVSAGTH